MSVLNLSGDEAPDVEAVLQLGVELVVLVPGGLLGPEDVEDLLVLRGAVLIFGKNFSEDHLFHLVIKLC